MTKTQALVAQIKAENNRIVPREEIQEAYDRVCKQYSHKFHLRPSHERSRELAVLGSQRTNLRILLQKIDVGGQVTGWLFSQARV